MGDVNGDVVSIDPVEVLAVTDRLVSAANRVAASGGRSGVSLVVPEDHFELAGMISDLETAREAFDRRFAEGLRSAGAKLAETALTVMDRDRFAQAVPMPLAVDRGPW